MLQNRFRKNPFYLSKFGDVIQSGFSVISRITTANLCKSVHDIINYSTFICPFETGKFKKEGTKLQKFEYLKNKRNLLDKIKNIFQTDLPLAFNVPART